MNEKPTLLIVDDTPANLALLRDILKEHYKIKIATNGIKALEIACSTPVPDLILLDIMMPEMDGYEVCRQLKANPTTTAIPVIFVTAKSDEDSETQGFELGAVDFITKPVKPPVVLARVATHLKLRAMQLELERQNQALEDAAKLRDDVELITRHDLKTPLNNIIALPSILLKKYSHSEDEEKLLSSIERSGHKMLQMINSSLDLYKMEVGTYPLMAQPMDLLPVLQGAVKEAATSTAASEKEWIIHLHGSPIKEGDQFWAKAEEMLCYPMFSNLLLNAFEASPKGGIVEIDLETEETKVRIMFTNRGSVPESIRDHFFEKYVTSGKESGTGIGTYSANLCAKTQQGSIIMESLENEQTRVTVTLPVMKRISMEELRAMFPAKAKQH